MVIDASAICAIIGREGDWDVYQSAIAAASDRLTHPVSLLEAAIILPRLTKKPAKTVEAMIADYCQLWRIEVAPIGPEVGQGAIEAYRTFGKGRGHPARLNLGDCFSYAVAKHAGMPLLFKGEDFSRTDLASAL